MQIDYLVVIGTDCTSSCKSNYHTIRTTTSPGENETAHNKTVICYIQVPFMAGLSEFYIKAEEKKTKNWKNKIPQFSTKED